MKSYLILGLTFAFSAAGFWLGLRWRSDARAGLDWPTTPGTIVSRSAAPVGRNKLYYPQVSYRFTVGGKEYTGERVYQIGRVDEQQSDVEKLVQALPDPVPVHYDPDAPAQAFLIENPASTYWIPLVFGIGALLFGLAQALAIFGRRP